MKYELQPLEQLVQLIIQEKATAETVPAILKEEERLLKAITENIFLLQTDYLVRQYICWHQDFLVKLADQLYRKASILRNQNIKKALVIILNLLDNLYRAFPEHIDSNVPLPKALLDKERRHYLSYLDTLKQSLNENKINPKLIEVTLIPLEEFVHKRPHKKVCYSDYQYIRHYVSEMKKLDFSQQSMKFWTMCFLIS